ncbi:MAG: AmmeMemoRadiSam system protein B [Deltaproteobacteria bacterium]|nr:AmmeMemoRadiSam system protein B [Deltaproteobacteria bacterium]
MSLRRPAFAGSWYPEEKQACRQQIEQFIAEDFTPPELSRPPRAAMVPHAGWFYSGAIACRVIQALQAEPLPDAVILFGMHMHPTQRPVMMDRGAWETPLGPLPVAENLARYLTQRLSFRIETPETPNRDNTIELQLPFIRYFFGEIPILAIGTPPSETAVEIAKTVVAGARELDLDLKIIGSTDLTHYGPNYGFTPHGKGAAAAAWVKEENDRRFIDAALGLNPEMVLGEALRHQNACCAGAAAATIQSALDLGASQGVLMAYTTSYDKIPGDSFVGYAGIAYC